MNPGQLSVSPAASHHLSEDELNDVLIGAPSSAAEAHLAACELCRAEVAEFEMPMSLFNQASMAWSEAKSNTLPRDLRGHRPGWGWVPGAAWGLATALLVSVALALTAGLHRTAAPVDTANASGAQAGLSRGTAPVTDRSREIADDNAMLKAIDSEIGRPEPSPLQLYQATDTGSTLDRHRHSTQMRN